MSYNAYRRKKEFNEITDRLYKDNHITEKEKKLLDYEIRRSEFMKTMNKRGKKADTQIVAQATKAIVKKTKEESNDDEYNTKVVNHIQHINKIMKPVLSEPNSIKRCINEYFNICKDDNIRPTVEGLALAIGVNRLTLLDWANGTKRVQNQEVIQKALQMVGVFYEAGMISNKISPVSAIFLMKNSLGYKDETSVNVSKNEDVDNEQLRKKYLEENTIIDGECEEKK